MYLKLFFLLFLLPFRVRSDQILLSRNTGLRLTDIYTQSKSSNDLFDSDNSSQNSLEKKLQPIILPRSDCLEPFILEIQAHTKTIGSRTQGVCSKDGQGPKTIFIQGLVYPHSSYSWGKKRIIEVSFFTTVCNLNLWLVLVLGTEGLNQRLPKLRSSGDGIHGTTVPFCGYFSKNQY